MTGTERAPSTGPGRLPGWWIVVAVVVFVGLVALVIVLSPRS